MNVLLSLLQKSTDYNQLLKAVEAKQAVAVSGLSQAPRSHVLAAVHEQSGRPLIAVCQDDMAAKRLASELGAFLGEEPPVLPSRELTLEPSACPVSGSSSGCGFYTRWRRAVSRCWWRVSMRCCCAQSRARRSFPRQ